LCNPVVVVVCEFATEELEVFLLLQEEWRWWISSSFSVVFRDTHSFPVDAVMFDLLAHTCFFEGLGFRVLQQQQQTNKQAPNPVVPFDLLFFLFGYVCGKTGCM
jgi:hypothetical protein